MLECFVGAAGQLQQPAEVHMRVGEMRILRQRLGIGPEGRRRVADLELQSYIEQLPGVRNLVPGPGVRRQRRGSTGGRDLRRRSSEVDLDLTGFRIPGGSALVNQDVVAISNDPDFAERPAAGKVPGKPA